MEHLQFDITVDASREKVWNSLWEDKNYRDWTSVFAPGSHADTDWKTGSKALFLDSNNDGMSSVIADKKTNEFMSIKHIGAVIKGVEHFNRPEDEPWSGALENYHLKTVDGKTELSVTLESKGIDEKMLDYFKDTWPLALEKLKEIAEQK